MNLIMHTSTSIEDPFRPHKVAMGWSCPQYYESSTSSSKSRIGTAAVAVGLVLSAGTTGMLDFIDPSISNGLKVNSYEFQLEPSSSKSFTFRRSKSSQEISEFPLSLRPFISIEGFHALQTAIRETYGNVLVDIFVHTDPEEDWKKPVFKVHSGIDDFDLLMTLEDTFFEKAKSNPTLLKTLPLVVVSLA